MTTTIKVQSHNYPALVTTIDKIGGGEASTSERVIRPEDGEVTFYCTTTRTRAISIVDLEYDDSRAVALKQASAA